MFQLLSVFQVVIMQSEEFRDSRKKFSVIGLKTASPQEITSMKEYCTEKGYKVRHKTTYTNGTKLPFNGVLLIDRRRKYLL